MVTCIFFCLVFLIPFHTGATARYMLAGLLDTCCLLLFWQSGGKTAKRLAQRAGRLVSTPLFLSMIMLFAAAVLSLIFTPDISRSIAATGEEFALNFVTFFLLMLFSAEFGAETDWISGFLIINAMFVAIYAGVMLQWFLAAGGSLWFVKSEILNPDVLWWLPPDITVMEASGLDRILSYGDGNTLFNGIKHSALYLTLFLSFATVAIAVKKHFHLALFLFFSDILLIVSTTKRCAMVAAAAGIMLSAMFFSSLRRYVAAAIVILLVIVVLIIGSDKNRYLVRENWNLILKGEIGRAMEQGGSIPLRICAYREFAAELADNPFRGTGPARKNIQKAYPETVSRCGLIHGHNSFLNMALYTGVQGMILLCAVIYFQAEILLRCRIGEGRGGDRELASAIFLFMVMFWGANMFMDGFRHGSALLYWLVTAVGTGRAFAATDDDAS